MSGSGYQVGKGFTVPSAIASPLSNLLLSININSSGGTILIGTYHYRYTYVTANGETAQSGGEGTLTVGSNTTYFVVNAPTSIPTGVGITGINIYIGPSGLETFQGYVVAGGQLNITSLSTTGQLVPQYNLTSYQDINPSTVGLTVGSEFIVHNIYYDTPVTCGAWDGTNLIPYSISNPGLVGSRMGLAVHCNGSQWLRIYNQSTTSVLHVSFDGMQMI